MSEANGTREHPRGSLLGYLVDEIDGVVIFVAAAVVAVATLVGKLESLQTVALVAMVVAIGVRVFRVRGQVESVTRSVTALGQLVTEQVNESLDQANEMGNVLQGRIADLKATGATEASLFQVQSDIHQLSRGITGHLHMAEMCDRTGFYRHMLDALRAANKTVDLTQLDEFPPSHYGTREMSEYFKQQSDLVISRPDILFRRIVAVPTLEKLVWLLDVLETVKDCPNFSVGLLTNFRVSNLPPPLSLQIFDRRELCLVDPSVGYMRPEDQRHMLWVKGSAIPEVFAIYYDSLWTEAERVKESTQIFREPLNGILAAALEKSPEKAAKGRDLSERISRLTSLQ